MNILVTGGAGFIGSALAKQLFAEGHSVVVIDNFNNYYDVQLKRDRVERLLTGVTVIEGDITDSAFLDTIFTKYSFEVVCHLAGNAGVRYSIDNPVKVVDANVTGTVQVLEAMKRHQVMRMVFASTSSVYGNDTRSPFVEAATAVQPMSVYGASKRADELLAYTYFALFGMQTTCLRFFTVYGPWSRPDMAMLKFAQKMTAGESIDVYNNGDLRRDFTYIDDIVTGFVLAVNKPLGYEIVNLGNGQAVELLSFINLLESALQIEAKKNLLPMQAGDVYETYADTSKAKELLGFQSSTDIEAGIKQFVHWYRDYYNV